MEQSTNPRKVANSVHGQLDREKFPRPRSRLRTWFREADLAVPSRVSLLILYTTAESGAYSRYSSRVPLRRPYIFCQYHTPSGQYRVYLVTQLRTGYVHCRESVGTGPVVLKVVRVTGAAFASPWTKCYCASLFSHTHYWYTVSMFKLSGVHQNISTAAVVYCCTVLRNRFSSRFMVCTRVKSSVSVHGTISSYVVFLNIVIIAALPRVRWHRASSPQGSSSNGCCLYITMDQTLLCSSLFPHPPLVYSEYVQLSGVYQNISTAVVYYCCPVL